MDLFDSPKQATQQHKLLPLAARMRPQNLDEFVGQLHLMAPGKILRRAIESDRLSSLILYGPPGVGKTTLARLIAERTNAVYETLNATASGVTQLRDVIQKAQQRARLNGQRTLLFIDEIHRFNRSQQDVLIPDLEEGTVLLIGATTANPSFALVPALLSRSLVCEFQPLKAEDIRTLMHRALSEEERGLGQHKTLLQEDALDHLTQVCDGDARRALNALEVAVLTTESNAEGVIELTLQVVEESIQRKAVVYDQAGDAHYDTASAFIKSMRGSDPDAALYWLAKMLYAGEDPRFIARRVMICASEDVGNADPRALMIAVAAMQATEFTGMPECRIPLAQAVTYIATSPKSNASYMGINQAMADVESGRTFPVPEALKDGHYKGAKKMGHGVGYEYAHNSAEHFIPQTYLAKDKPEYYTPTGLGYEKHIKERLDHWRALQKAVQ